MIYRIARPKRQIDFNINHIIEVNHRKNAPTLADERITFELLGEIKYRFTGQEAIDMWQDYRNIILPALGGKIN